MTNNLTEVEAQKLILSAQKFAREQGSIVYIVGTKTLPTKIVQPANIIFHDRVVLWAIVSPNYDNTTTVDLTECDSGE